MKRSGATSPSTTAPASTTSTCRRPERTPPPAPNQRQTLRATSSAKASMLRACARSIRSASPSATVKNESSSSMQPEGQSPHARRKTKCQRPCTFAASISGPSPNAASGSAVSDTADRAIRPDRRSDVRALVEVQDDRVEDGERLNRPEPERRIEGIERRMPGSRQGGDALAIPRADDRIAQRALQAEKKRRRAVRVPRRNRCHRRMRAPDERQRLLDLVDERALPPAVQQEVVALSLQDTVGQNARPRRPPTPTGTRARRTPHPPPQGQPGFPPSRSRSKPRRSPQRAPSAIAACGLRASVSREEAALPFTPAVEATISQECDGIMA